MPLFKEGRYGELGHWGQRKRFRLPSRRISALVLVLLSIGAIFVASRPSGIIPYVFGDYNTSFSHTRTPIFTDNKFQSSSPIISLDTHVKSGNCNTNSCAATLTGQKAGDLIVVSAGDFGEAGCPGGMTISDSQSLTWTQQSCLNSHSTFQQGQAIIWTAPGVSTSNDVITITDGTGTKAFIASAFTGPTSATALSGASGNNQAATGSTTINSASTDFIVDFDNGVDDANTLGITWTLSGSLTSIDGNNPVSGGWPQIQAGFGIGQTAWTDSWSSGDGNIGFQHLGIRLTGSAQNFSLVRWNFNSTCVTLGVVASAQFDFSLGTSGSGGNNCSSGDIMISKASVNLQTAAGRMLEMVQAWNPEAVTTGTRLQNVSIILRTNGTLPKFTENYNPFNDVQARLIWNGCPSFICSNGLQTLYVGHDNTKSISQESLANDLVINGTLDHFKGNNQEPFQTVLNFTGPTNFMSQSSSANDTISTKTASSLQMGQDYYILVQATFSGSPCANCFVLFLSGQPVGSGNPSFGMWSVPPSCADPLNQGVCSGQGTPVFQFNPLDPSSWGNAIIKGLLWVGSVAIPQAFGIMTSVIAGVISIVGNTIGGFLGWGPIGTNIVTFFAGLPPLFASIGTAFTWLGGLVTGAGSMITFAGSLSSTYFPGLTNLLSDISNGTPEVVSLAGELAIWFPSSYMIIMLFFYFLLVIMNGMRGFFDWIRLVKWSSFSIYNLFARLFSGFLDLITAILGRLSVISPGHPFPIIPKLNAGPVPHVSLNFRDMALFHDPTAWFFGTIGFVFVALFAGTSASGLPAASVTQISSMGPLFLVLFGTMFMMLILYIPMFILGKLKEHT